MRIRLTLLTALAAVALSSAPAHASVCPNRPYFDTDCTTLFLDYWEDPTQPWCPTVGCDWLVIH